MKTTIQLSEDTRDRLRVFKAEHGLSYDEAVTKLMEEYPDE